MCASKTRSGGLALCLLPACLVYPLEKLQLHLWLIVEANPLLLARVCRGYVFEDGLVMLEWGSVTVSDSANNTTDDTTYPSPSPDANTTDDTTSPKPIDDRDYYVIKTWENDTWIEDTGELTCWWDGVYDAGGGSQG